MPSSALAKPIELALQDVRNSLNDEWQFPAIDNWQQFETLNEALPLLATLVGGERYLWWVSGDIAEALMRRFGRSESIKRALGSVFGRKARTVEDRARAALMFPPEMRYPDVPVELYREALRWGDKEAIPMLEAALDDGRSWFDLRMERYTRDGKDVAAPIFHNARAKLSWQRRGDKTQYIIVISEEGEPRFARNDFDIVVTVSPSTRRDDAE
ncbi:hypothetical protein KKH23_09705 [Patescibacteria group bacterium]|nr:hypothetical protein [Patescibacteria group bacterium]